MCGVTAAGPGTDYGLGTGLPVGTFLTRYRDLARSLGFPVVAVCRQVHGAGVRVLRRTPDAGPAEGGTTVIVAGEADGLLTAGSGVLLAVTAADCVPIYLRATGSPAVGLLHAGWRGTAAGVLEAGLEALRAEWGIATGVLQVHLGPSICGDCYEVGPEVPQALGLPPRRHVDLRAELVRRARAAGVPPGRISTSTWCTRCAPDRFHSHRGTGVDAGRMAAFLGRRTGCRRVER